MTIRYPADVINLFNTFFSKKNTNTAVSTVTSNPKYLIAIIFTNNHMCRCTTLSYFMETTGPFIFSIPFQLLCWIYLYLPTLSEVILNIFWFGVSRIDDLVGQYLKLTDSIVRWGYCHSCKTKFTCHVKKLKLNFVAGCFS